MTTATIDLSRTYTADEFLCLDIDFPAELVTGRIVEMAVPTPRHGQICSKIDRIVGGYADQHRLGHVVVNDAGIRTKREPDTVRGADVAFYSFERVPPGPLPKGYLDVMSEVVFEVRSPSDRTQQILAKVAEYLGAGVKLVCVLDPVTQALMACEPDELPITMHNSDEFHFPAFFGELRVPVCRFFE
jgi:Uma2 family endonuclease